MAKLIEKYFPHGLEGAEQITTVLTEAIDFCDRRNLLAHGEWWHFHPPTSTITVRSSTLWGDEGPDEVPKHEDFTAADICALTEKFKDLEDELCRLRRDIEGPSICRMPY
jgi:hypothetical protein